MTTISSLYRIPASAVLTPLAGLDVKKVDNDIFARIANLSEPDFSSLKPDNRLDQIYATVKVDGKVVATLYNGGSAVTSNATYAQVGGLPSMGEGEKLVGPALAQKRAREIAEALGGKIEMHSTAQSAAEWRAQGTQGGQQAETNAAAQTRINAQLLAQEQPSVTGSAEEQFMTFMASVKENPGGFMRAQILESMGLTEEDVKAMSPEDREKLEAKIEELIKKKLLKDQAASGTDKTL